MPSQHSNFPPSSMGRLIACPASNSRSKGKEKKETAVMREGTLAHAVLENRLLGRLPSDWKLPKWAKHRDITAEIRNAVDEAVATITEIRNEWPAEEGIEQKVTLAPWGLPEVWGTADYVAKRVLNRAVVLDYKHGAGKWVAADDAQLKTYAAGVLPPEILANHGEVELIVIQPRCVRKGGPTTRRHLMVADELEQWVQEVLHPAIADAKSANPTVRPGEEQCDWCPGKNECPEYHAFSASVASLQFADLCVPAVVKTPIIPESPEMLGNLYRQLPVLKSWIKHIETEVAAATIAGKATGLKYVAGRGSRKWKDEEGARKLLQGEYLLDDDAIYGERTMLGVAKLERLITGGKKLLEPFVEKSKGKPALVPQEDARPAIDTAVLDFADLAEEDGD